MNTLQFSFTNILDLIGVFLGIAFLIMSVRGSKSLMGSFFRNYYWLMIAGALALTFGFIIEPVGDWIGLRENTIMLLHDLAMLTESVLFVYASYVLPNDARRYIESKERPTV